MCCHVSTDPLEAVQQRRLVPLDGQHVVGAGDHDLGGDFRLAAHGIDGHQTAGNFENFQQFRNGRDLVALLVHDHLTQADVIRRSPNADHVNGRFAAGRVETAAQRFAIDGHNLAGTDLMQRRDETPQTFLKLGRLDRAQDGVEAIVRRDARGQVQKLRQPRTLLPSPGSDRDKIVRTGDDRIYGDRDVRNEPVFDYSCSV
jgi:hypothetical protein